MAEDINTTKEQNCTMAIFVEYVQDLESVRKVKNPKYYQTKREKSSVCVVILVVKNFLDHRLWGEFHLFQ